MDRQVYCCDKDTCGFWAEDVIVFQEHYVIQHTTNPLYVCSNCPFRGRLRDSIANHIKTKQRKESGEPEQVHADASCVLIDPFPDRRDEYIRLLQTVRLPSDESKGTLSVACPISGRLRSHSGEMPSSSDDDGGSDSSKSYRPQRDSSTLMETKDVYHCPQCSYWAENIQTFRDHVAVHIGGFELIVSGGGFNNHVRPARVKKDSCYGWLDKEEEEESSSGSSSTEVEIVSEGSGSDWTPPSTVSDSTRTTRTNGHESSSAESDANQSMDQEEESEEWDDTPLANRSDLTEPLQRTSSRHSIGIRPIPPAFYSLY